MVSFSVINSLLSRRAVKYSSSIVLRRPYWLSSKLYYSIQVENRVQDKLVSVKWDDGKVTDYPHVYLRDNCRCPSCFDPQAQQRIISNPIYHNYTDAIVKTACMNENKDKLHLEWINDGEHTSSVFELDWLKAHRFTGDDKKDVHPIKRQLWGSEIQHDIPQFDFDRILNDKSELYRWLRCVMERGIALIVGLPKRAGQVEKVAAKIGHLRETIYGPTFHSQSKGDHVTTVTYKSGGLALHTDFPYYNNIPGIFMLHCVTAAKQGGESQFTDGFKAAEQLRASHPQYFKILAETPVEHEDTGTDSYEFSLTAEHPIIRLNENGNLKQIYYGDHTRTSRIDVPHYKLTDFYNAMTQFLRYAYSPANIIQFKLQPGTLISVDNFRVLHGRTAFVVSPDNFRHVEGGHVDWDGAISCMRVLEKELNIDYRTPNI
ncbi:uncharacterized protein TRIADDRAFT_26039 [Trichoplax adhaerens]|uniref:Gamma-butyrobetaine dioxygenase n=2 Tax=Trichoplax adhaerens TaxID=10228 RepID=B3RWF9_TRIAD|nr:hypothetical protein TRIADDRAFT_26039 [Trichoplax adhaerens]EDV24686.1 hypothetical protein TRIADDRAFT_26039 [Trichoplax adhaerens]|eukprot:XP_002112576.1 hypothetical protein TRIADDRAFT_26039 [Trichoplax adhaerens]